MLQRERENVQPITQERGQSSIFSFRWQACKWTSCLFLRVCQTPVWPSVLSLALGGLILLILFPHTHRCSCTSPASSPNRRPSVSHPQTFNPPRELHCRPTPSCNPALPSPHPNTKPPLTNTEVRAGHQSETTEAAAEKALTPPCRLSSHPQAL